MNFNVVCPVKDEVGLLSRTLPSFHSVETSEVILCAHSPLSKGVVEKMAEVAHNCGILEKTTILEAPPNPRFCYHRAWVGRCGFTRARNDEIPATDVDLELSRKALKAVRRARKGRTGLCSCGKSHRGHNPFDTLPL